MNILTIGLNQNTIEIFNQLSTNPVNKVLHLTNREKAIITIKDVRLLWDWIVLQGSDEPSYWKSILCAINSSPQHSQITVLSSHIDGTRLTTPVCSMHSSDDNKLTVSRCAMQSILQQEPSIPYTPENSTQEPAPIVFEYHAPCR